MLQRDFKKLSKDKEFFRCIICCLKDCRANILRRVDRLKDESSTFDSPCVDTGVEGSTNRSAKASTSLRSVQKECKVNCTEDTVVCSGLLTYLYSSTASHQWAEPHFYPSNRGV